MHATVAPYASSAALPAGAVGQFKEGAEGPAAGPPAQPSPLGVGADSQLQGKLGVDTGLPRQAFEA